MPEVSFRQLTVQTAHTGDSDDSSAKPSSELDLLRATPSSFDSTIPCFSNAFSKLSIFCRRMSVQPTSEVRADSPCALLPAELALAPSALAPGLPDSASAEACRTILALRDAFLIGVQSCDLRWQAQSGTLGFAASVTSALQLSIRRWSGRTFSSSPIRFFSVSIAASDDPVVAIGTLPSGLAASSASRAAMSSRCRSLISSSSPILSCASKSCSCSYTPVTESAS